MKPEPETPAWYMLLAVCVFIIAIYSIGELVWGMEQVMVTDSAPWYVAYFWEILALTVAPLFGFMIGQWYKASAEVKPSNGRIALFAGGATALAALLCWTENHPLEQAAKIAMLIGVLQPLIVTIWFWVADKFAPQQAASLRGTDEEITIIPWIIKAKRNHVAGGKL